MKKITGNKLEITSNIIAEEEQLWINEFLLKMNVPDFEEVLIYKIYGTQLLTRNSFKKPEKWEEQLLWQVRMNILMSK